MSKRPLLLIGIVICSVLILMSVFAPMLAPNNPNTVSMANAAEGSTGQFPLGTDQLGRCTLSRLIYGSRVSLGTALLVTVVSSAIGITVGVVSGLYAGRVADKLLTVVCEVMLAFPGIILALVIAGTLGPGIVNMMLAISLVNWAGFARIVRSLVIGVKDEEYIKAARASGTRGIRLAVRHILPNISGAAATVIATNLGNVILQIAALSFLGLGAEFPTAEWGMMVSDARMHAAAMPSLMVYPVAAVSIAVLGFHLIGDGLKDISDSMEV